VCPASQKRCVTLISIKPFSRGLWPKDVKQTYEWWYRPLEEENEYQLDMDWVLALPGMVSTLPTSYFDVFDKIRGRRAPIPAHSARSPGFPQGARPNLYSHLQTRPHRRNTRRRLPRPARKQPLPGEVFLNFQQAGCCEAF
jgi:hypothetical protein